MDSDPVSIVPAHPPRARTTRVDRAAWTPCGPLGPDLRRARGGGAGPGVRGPRRRRPGPGPGGGAAGPGGRRVGRADGAGLRLLGPRPLAGRGPAEPGPGPTDPRRPRRRPRSVRWPSAMAAILGGWILVRGLHRIFGYRAAIWGGVCWFASLAVIDRSAGLGVDMILGRGDPGGRRPAADARGGLGRRDSGPRWRSWPGDGRRCC